MERSRPAQQQAEASAVVLDRLGVLLIAPRIDTAHINPDFLRYNEIVDSGWAVKRASKKPVFAPYGAASAGSSQSAPRPRCSPAVPHSLCSNAAAGPTSPACAPPPNAAAIPQNHAAPPRATLSPGGSPTAPAPTPTTPRDTRHQPKSAAAATSCPPVPPIPARHRPDPAPPPDALLPPAAAPPYLPRYDACVPALFCRRRNRAAPFFSSFHRLAVNNGGAGFGMAAFALPQLLA